MKKSCLTVLILTLTALLLTACGARPKQALTSGEVNGENVAQVCDVLRDAGLSNVDVFEQWVRSSAAPADASASGFTDADCRMTVMLLAGEQLRAASVEPSYEGTYLMFDVDAIENQPEFEILRGKKDLFTTMFGEMPIPESGLADALPRNWQSHGIAFDQEQVSIISIVFQSFDGREAFVGHTGLLIDCGGREDVAGKFLFVEKIAFGDPFRVTVVQDEAELLQVLSQRPDYSVQEGEAAPVVCKNAEQIGALSPALS